MKLFDLTLMKYSLSPSPAAAEPFLFTSILIFPCPKGAALSAGEPDADFLAALPSSTSMSRLGHVHTRKFIVLRPRIWAVIQWCRENSLQNFYT